MRDYFIKCERLAWAADLKEGELALEQNIAADAPRVTFALAARDVDGV